MQRKLSNPNNQGISAAYEAVVDYHNNLVHMRFTVAGLFLTANGFLASTFFQTSPSSPLLVFLPALAILISIICWMLEVRTYQLLENLVKRGRSLEIALHLPRNQGFFSLMKLQDRKIKPRLIPLPSKYRIQDTSSEVRWLFSHSTGVGLLYVVVAAFWVIMLILVLT